MLNSELDVLADFSRWLSLSEWEQDEIISAVEIGLGDEFAHLFTRSYTPIESFRVATFEYKPSSCEMNLIIGGEVQMGLSLKEENQAKAIANPFPFDIETMRPVHTVMVRPFLMSRFPLLHSFVSRHITLDLTLFRPEFTENEEGEVPIYLTREEVTKLSQQFAYNLLSESQWEYAYRGGSTDLFYFGDAFPSEAVLESQILLCNFSDEDANIQAANPFGLVGLGVGE